MIKLRRKDGLFWKLEARGRFSVGSLYRLLKRSQIQFPYSFLWNIKVPLKIKFGKRDRKLVLVGFAAVIWVIWKTRNDACFRNMMPNDPSAVVFAICAMINHWSGLQKSSSQE
ncbi:hypothetical protein BRADI_4g35542v3, partial [Brachypodium distachyon]